MISSLTRYTTAQGLQHPRIQPQLILQRTRCNDHARTDSDSPRTTSCIASGYDTHSTASSRSWLDGCTRATSGCVGTTSFDDSAAVGRLASDQPSRRGSGNCHRRTVFCISNRCRSVPSPCYRRAGTRPALIPERISEPLSTRPRSQEGHEIRSKTAQWKRRN